MRAAGVTKGAMYHHFDNKEALGYAVVDEVVAGIMREKWQSPLQAARDPLDALIGVVRSTSLRPEHVCGGCPLNNLSQEMSPLDHGFRRRTAKVFNDWHRAVAAALRSGKLRGMVRKEVNPDEAATFLIAAYEGYISLAKNSQDPERAAGRPKSLDQLPGNAAPATRRQGHGAAPLTASLRTYRLVGISRGSLSSR